MNKDNHVKKKTNDETVARIKKLKDYYKVPKQVLVSPPPNSIHGTDKKDFNSPNQLKDLVESHASKLADAEAVMEVLPDVAFVKESLISSILSPKDSKDVDLTITTSESAPPEFCELVRSHFDTVVPLNEQKATILGSALFDKGSFPILTIPPNTIRALIKKNTYGLEDITKRIYTERHSVCGLISTSKIVNVKERITSASKDKSKGIGLEGFDFAMGNDANAVYEFPNSAARYKNSKEYKPQDILTLSDDLSLMLQDVVIRETSQLRTNQLVSSFYGIEAVGDLDKREETEHTRILESNNKAIKANKLENVVDQRKRVDVYNNRAVRMELYSALEEQEEMEHDLNPITILLPTECVVPVHIPGSPEEHVGYYIVLDERNRPLTYSTNSNKYKELNDRLNKTVDAQALTSVLNIGSTNNSTNARERLSIKDTNKALLDAYYVEFEKELAKAVRDANGGDVEVSNPGELHRIMLFRQLEKQRTQLLYVPKKFLTYIAFNYDESGIGVSLIEKTKLYASFRTVLMFATIMAAVKASVNRSIMAVKLDPDDPDPRATVETVINEMAQMNSTGMPIGRINPVDIINTLQQAAIQVKVDGGEKFPSMDVDLTEKKRDVSPPSSDVMDMLRKMHYAGLGVDLDTVDNTADNESTATAIISRNVYKARRTKKHQDTFTALLAKYIQTYIMLGGPLTKELHRLYTESKDSISVTFEELISSIQVKLPAPDVAVIKTQADDYANYVAFLEVAVDAYINGDMLKDQLTGEYENANMDDVKAQVLAQLKREFLRSENMLPELDAALANEESPLLESVKQHNELVIDIVGDMLRASMKYENAQDEKTKALKEELNPEENNENNEGETSSEGNEGGEGSEGGETLGGEEGSTESEGGEEGGSSEGSGDEGELGGEDDFGSILGDNEGNESGSNETATEPTESEKPAIEEKPEEPVKEEAEPTKEEPEESLEVETEKEEPEEKETPPVKEEPIKETASAPSKPEPAPKKEPEEKETKEKKSEETEKTEEESEQKEEKEKLAEEKEAEKAKEKEDKEKAKAEEKEKKEKDKESEEESDKKDKEPNKDEAKEKEDKEKAKADDKEKAKLIKDKEEKPENKQRSVKLGPRKLIK